MRSPLLSRSLTSVAAACLLAMLTACQRDKNIITKEECVGTYQYRFPGHAEGSVCFTLHTDGTYVLGPQQGHQEGLAFFRLSPTGPWHISDGKRQQLYMDRVTVPLRRVNGGLSAMMNNDYEIACVLPTGTNATQHP